MLTHLIARLGGGFRIARIRHAARKRILDELGSYRPEELQADLGLFPADIARLAAEQAELEVRAYRRRAHMAWIEHTQACDADPLGNLHFLRS